MYPIVPNKKPLETVTDNIALIDGDDLSRLRQEAADLSSLHSYFINPPRRIF